MTFNFIILSESWYAEANLKNRLDNVFDEIQIEKRGKELYGEMKIQWQTLGHKHTGAELCMFDDSWVLLDDPKIKGFLSVLSKWGNENATVPKVAELLRRLGFKDATPRKKK